MFDDESFAAQRIGQAPGKFRVIFDEKNANGCLLPGRFLRNRDTGKPALYSLRSASRQLHASLACESRRSSNGTLVVFVGQRGAKP